MLYKIFNFLFTDDLIDMLVEQCNLKSFQNNINKPANIRREDIEELIGFLIFMPCVKFQEFIGRNIRNKQNRMS